MNTTDYARTRMVCAFEDWLREMSDTHRTEIREATLWLRRVFDDWQSQRDYAYNAARANLGIGYATHAAVLEGE